MKRLTSFGIVPGLIVLILLILPCYSESAEIALVMSSDSGDYVGQGQSYFYSIEDGSFTAQRNSDNGVSISFSSLDNAHWWYLDFAAPNNGPLTVGTYYGAMRFPSQDINKPGLSVYGDGSVCNTLTGSFDVKQISYGTNNDINAFWATFEQHCEGGAPALGGEIRFNADAPDTVTTISVSWNPSIVGQPVTFPARVLSTDGIPTGAVTFMDGQTALGTGVLSGSPATATLTTAALSVGTHSITALYNGDGNFQPSTSFVKPLTVQQRDATILMMNSDPGDYIGYGQYYFYTIADGTFTAQRNSGNGVSISFITPHYEHWWYLDFASRKDLSLTVGTYSGAMRFPFRDPNRPGLSVYGDGSGCNTLKGDFVVKQISYGTNDDINAFWATFVQHCEGNKPALRGEIRFNADVPVITINSPDNGNTWSRGTSQIISWSYTGAPVKKVSMQLLKGGNVIKTIKSRSGIGKGGIGTYKWRVPYKLEPGDDYQIRITGTTKNMYPSSSTSNFFGIQ